jgi:hypothetical protein
MSIHADKTAQQGELGRILAEYDEIKLRHNPKP